MFTTSEIFPLPVLSPFIQSYRLCETNSGSFDAIRPSHTSDENILSFNFTRSANRRNSKFDILSISSVCAEMEGIGAKNNDHSMLNSCYLLLEIIFKPNGFSKIFKIATTEKYNDVLYVDEFLNSNVITLFEQLPFAKDLKKLGIIIDAHLINYLCKTKLRDINDVINSLYNLIVKEKGNVTVDDLARKANMSKRNFERRFTGQIGISPKLLCCINRFNHAVSVKLEKPEQSWFSVAHESGYFDQMHLIKDFKRFTGTTPSDFLQQIHLSQ